MSKLFSRRQFIDRGSAAALGFATFSLFSLGNKSALSQQSQNKAFSPQLFANLEQQIPLLMHKAIVPGMAMAVVKDSQILWSHGFGVKNANTGEAVNSNTVFAAASLSKPVFAYTVMKMCDRGELDLDTPLTEYTTKPYISDPRIKLITARMVLDHTCGFPNWSGDDPVWIDFTPGTRFSYSSEGFIYLQKVIETITKQPLHEYVNRHVFAPLGMDNSSYVWQQKYNYLAANGHDRQGNPAPLNKPSQALSAGSLQTTATDFAKFLIAMMEPGINDAFRLNENSLNQMLHLNAKINQSLGWGLGWGLEKTPDGDFFWHWGDGGIYKSITFGSRALKTAIVILTNSANGLQITPEIVSRSIGSKHPAFDFSMIDY